MTTQLVQSLSNTVGILLTMGGAVLIAVDVTRIYKKEKFNPSVGVMASTVFDGSAVVSRPPTETKEYSKWLKINHRLMGWGLGLVLVGGAFQIVAIWLPCLIKFIEK